MKNNKNFKIIIVVGFCCMVGVIFGFIFFNFAIPKDTYHNKTTMIVTTNQQKLTSDHNLSVLISNQWYSSIFSFFPSAPLYAMPLAFQFTPKGLGFSYPTVNATQNVIKAPYIQDFTIGFSDGCEKPKITSIGDWSISGLLKDKSSNSLSFVLAHGVPSAVLHVNATRLQISFSDTPYFEASGKQIESGTFFVDSFMATIYNHVYIFVLPKKTKIQNINNNLFVENPQRVFVGLLDKKEHENLFKNAAFVDILNTQADPQITPNTVSVTYQLVTQNGIPLIALYPHQYDNLATQQNILGSYSTLRGDLKLIQSNSFTTSVPLVSPDGTFEKLLQDHPDLITQIKQDDLALLKEKIPDSHDYYLGKWFGKVSNLILLSDKFGLKNEKEKLMAYVEPILLKSLDDFVYNSPKTSIVAKYPEFGNENLNDHHFHYGYYIRTAAVLSNFDLNFLPKVQGKINEMVKDVATIQRDNNNYPFLRNFDIYEGHSWADGIGNTQDGNNQESTSEALNCWYGIYLWSKIINDMNFQKYALYLYNTEMQSAYYYWFNTKNIYPSAYSHAIVSLVWGGKAGFETWFSDDSNKKYGIQLLPITPGSKYLGSIPNFSKYLQDYSKNDAHFNKPWSDLFLIWSSFYQPETAMKFKNTVTAFEDGNSKSVFLYFIYANQENAISK